VISEFSLSTLLILIPLLTGGAAWFNWEYDKSKCAFQSFANSRREMIATEEKSTVPIQIGSMKEAIELLPLESLDQGEDGLSFSDLGTEASQLSEDASRSYRQLQGLASTGLSTTYTP
jgi:hypothetical protein